VLRRRLDMIIDRTIQQPPNTVIKISAADRTTITIELVAGITGFVKLNVNSNIAYTFHRFSSVHHTH
jgi:hypothetical protein